ncbi:hypothetical protein GM3708_1105 [Geminocystis sp. NIES-3708]|uniref:hypothetical protein n=1 Tax=Geminocystis sp. NIES-3708 TaxID=1615909 RepID=UPI0005FC50A2|nr:hypothetical protein [Geminocystis sp. NIES-3708]BAQ60699.1 hypothetical protein GM3708_1105 [Geminocystis sp. NIES-3708]
MDLSTHDVIGYGLFFAQIIKDPDIIGQITDAWKNFIESGQVWALLIGVFFGYTFANFTRF